MNAIKAVFIDRDGTLNEDPDGYIDKPENFKLFPYAAECNKKTKYFRIQDLCDHKSIRNCQRLFTAMKIWKKSMLR